MSLKRTEKVRVNKFLRKIYPGARNIKYEYSGAVTCLVDRRPYTTRPGRIFAGWGEELLSFIKHSEEDTL